jgi:hypothetical protein
MKGESMSNNYDDGSDPKIPPEKEGLMSIAVLVHNALRKLKIGEKATIACEKHAPGEMVNYIRAYSFHKEKWFDTTYDATSKVLTAVRGEPPPWDEPELRGVNDDEEA